MCGRYASARKRIELLEEFRVERDRVTQDLEPDYNVAPTKRVYAVLTRGTREDAGREREGAGRERAGGSDHGDGADNAARARSAAAGAQPGGVARELRVVRWGLVPSWAKDRTIGSRLINARAETVEVKPAFRRAFAHRRCLLPADGYYEWQRLDAGTGKSGAKQPYFICRSDGAPLAFAGLYELWRDKDLPDDHEQAWLWTATIITTSAPDELGRIHDRMPMVVQPDQWADWLDPSDDDPAGLMPMLAPAASAGLISYPVSTAVNSVRNNGPQLVGRV
jgi:putative SOS response-associated peptidase YedK